MNQALIYGLLSGFALLIGAGCALIFKFKQKIIAAIMAFGSGLLICALTFGLINQAFLHGGFTSVILGFLLGGVVFIAGDYLLHYLGARAHRRKKLLESKFPSNGGIITMGAILDGIPESIALGVSLFFGQSTGLLVLSGIFLSNFAEGISSVPGLLKEGFSKLKITLIWVIVGMAIALLTVLSFTFLHDINSAIIGSIEAFAAGAILAMLADSMMPEAYEEGGFLIGLLTILGFLTAFIISRI
ncbi:MAG: ZIP family zinc transporter [Patescibacteria group bacterium]|nr:ZIP family zinc transporter [Patescibacteria group bacterium]